MTPHRIGRDLHPIPLADVAATLAGVGPPQIIMTMSEGQWDTVLSVAYEKGYVLLELDDDEQPVRAYQKPAEATP